MAGTVKRSPHAWAAWAALASSLAVTALSWSPAVGIVELLLLATLASLVRLRRRGTAVAAALRAANHDLARARDAAETQCRARAALLGQLARELRAPIDVVVDRARRALATELTVEQRDHLEAARAPAEGVQRLLGDVLDVATLDAGEVTLAAAPFGLRAALGEALRRLAERAQARGLELVLHVAPHTPDGFVGDVRRVRQLAAQLTADAVERTARGEVVLRVDGHVDGRVAFAVRHDAIDVPEPLGLAIGRRLAELLDGGLTVDGEAGGGVELRATLQLSLDPAAPPTAAPRGGRALVIDDSAAAREAQAALLGEFGMEVVAVDAGDAPAAAAAPARFDVVLLDDHMPGVDVAALAARLAAAQPAARLLLLLPPGRSAVACDAVDEAFRVVKPLGAGPLRAALAAAPRGAAPRVDELPRAPRPLRVLVAEDGAQSRERLAAWLAAAGHKVVVVEDGRRAVDAALAVRFDAALLDVEMPEPAGLAVAAELRAAERAHGGRLPLIALAPDGASERCRDAGIDVAVTKPIAAAALLAALGAATDAGARPPFDRRRALAALDGDAALLGEILRDYLALAPAARLALEDAVRRRDACGVASSARLLKGVLLALAADGASRVAQRLEDQGRSGRLAGAAAAAAALRAELALLDVAVDAELRAA